MLCYAAVGFQGAAARNAVAPSENAAAFEDAAPKRVTRHGIDAAFEDAAPKASPSETPKKARLSAPVPTANGGGGAAGSSLPLSAMLMSSGVGGDAVVRTVGSWLSARDVAQMNGLLSSDVNELNRLLARDKELLRMNDASVGAAVADVSADPRQALGALARLSPVRLQQQGPSTTAASAAAAPSTPTAAPDASPDKASKPTGPIIAVVTLVLASLILCCCVARGWRDQRQKLEAEKQETRMEDLHEVWVRP